MIPLTDPLSLAVTLPKPPGCTKNDDCPNDESCINRMCRNPCDCGVDAECLVRDHRPICSCKDGYEGNPNIACRAGKARSSNQVLKPV